MAGWQIGVDVGGTFTDVMAVEPALGIFRVAKVPSTPGDQSVGVMAGLAKAGLDPAEAAAFVHGTTVGTNAVLERKGAKCGLVTTQGFRDTLELGRRTRPNPYGMIGSFEPMISRENRLEVPERMDAAGRALVPLDEAALRVAVQTLITAGAEALVIHFLHSYANPVHELRAAEIAREMWPNTYISVGHEILREVREFERASTAAVNASIQPVMARYLGRLASLLAKGGFEREPLVMQGNAGTMTVRAASEHAVQTVMSGPAAGVLAAARIGAEAGLHNVIACDMGGTSFDVTLIRDGAPSLSAEKDVAYGMPVRVPMIDIHSIGAGGGSIARINRAGILQVGPQSAGSRPGPICYGRGGEDPTVTDANLLLGRLDPSSMPGIEAPASLDIVRAAMLERIGKPLGLDAIQAAAAVITVATNHLASAIRLVSVERGFDPRDFALLAFGGAGPLHAAALATELGVPRVLVPRFPGATSALGCILADLRHDFVQTVNLPLAEADGAAMDAILAEHTKRGHEVIARERVPVESIVAVHEADLLFRGQSHVFRMPVASPGFDNAAVMRDFAARYKARFDIELAEMRAMLVNLRTSVQGIRPKVAMEIFSPLATSSGVTGPRAARGVTFGGRVHETPVWSRESLPAGRTLRGPLIVEQMDATTVVDPGAQLEVDHLGNLIITVGGPA